MKKSILLFSSFLLLLLVSCTGETGDPDNPLTGQYIRCNVNGTNWEVVDDSISTALTNFDHPLAGIVGGYTSTQISVHMFLQYPVSTNDTSLIISDSSNSVLHYHNSNIWECKNGQATFHKETSTIPYVTAIWTGTFSGVYKNLSAPSADSIVITNGEFEAHTLL